MDLRKLSKKQSGLVILIVYALTMGIGIACYMIIESLIGEPIIAMFIADAIMTVIIFVIGSAIKNASLYDPYWSVIPPFIIVVWLLEMSTTFNIKVVLIILAFMIWAVRLTYNWWKNWVGFRKQDWRYDLLRDKNPKIYPLTNFVGIHFVPTVVVFIQMLAVYHALNSTTVKPIFYLGFSLAVIAPLIQFIADRQMYRFRQENHVGKTVINTGLWRFSRHPNYFGELLFWVGVYLMSASDLAMFNLYLLAPLAMIALFEFISVPMMENKLAKRPGYAEYRRSVSRILPFFRRKQA